MVCVCVFDLAHSLSVQARYVHVTYIGRNSPPKGTRRLSQWCALRRTGLEESD